MSEPAIQVEGVSKRYRIGAREEGKTFREALVDTLATPFRRLKSFGRSSHREEDSIWALKDVSFEIQPGQAIGIIGRNGAGKSTLLKILSHITEPTEGRVVLRGRVASMLEVGTGFHNELTGRENIYLSGTILGMRKREIDARFDEIVAFSGIEKFLDTQVKRYSSGMWVRLGFAVAAHLQPEILLIDEVLAVGDAEFRKKSLGKMGEVARGGRTVLFVSHNMAAVEGLCQDAILLSQGVMVERGPAEQVIQHYLHDGLTSENSTTSLVSHEGRQRGSEVILQEVRIFADGVPSTVVKMGGLLKIATVVKRDRPLRDLCLVIAIEDHAGRRVAAFTPQFQAAELLMDSVNGGTITCEIPRLRLLPGLYYVTLLVKRGQYMMSKDLDRIERAVQFTVERADVFGTGCAPHPSAHGVFFQEASWEFDPE